jgi:tetratricopeptide (TPR) repeat protein/transcriptional regulator with XRE-family HTH domain
VTEQAALTFAGLLRQLRSEAMLTQEELAEAAGVSQRAVSDLERGINRTARKDTALLLADALGLDGPARGLFVSAARGKTPAAQVLAAVREEPPGAVAAAATRTLPRDIANFTGRERELAQLWEAVAGTAARGGVVGIQVIDGMAGVGKTTFAVHVAHQLAASFPDGQFFLPLHAHTPGQRPVDPADALASLLLAAGVSAARVPPGVEARAGLWRDYTAGRRIELLLDDAAGHEQVRPLLPGAVGSLVLVTSRRRLSAIEDAAVISLDTPPPMEAATLLVRLAGRPGMRAGDDAVAEIARLCGYLPLAIGMLASQLRCHPAWTAASMAADLAAARDRLALLHAENLSVAAAFDLSYQNLAPGPQQLFRRLSLVPGSSFDAYATAALDGTSPDASRRHLDALYDQHLLAESAPGRYRLHDLLRDYARALAAADGAAESDAATGRLLDYYLHTARAAGRHFDSSAAGEGHEPERSAAYAPDLADLGQAAVWLELELPNLFAAVAYAATCGRTLHALQIPATLRSFLATHGHRDQMIALQRIARAAARQARNQGRLPAARTWPGIAGGPVGTPWAATAASLGQVLALYQADASDQIVFLRSLTEDTPAAAASYQQALALGRLGIPLGEAIAAVHLGLALQRVGNYHAAAASLQRAAELFRDLGHWDGQAWTLSNLGVVQEETADYAAAAASHQQALGLFRDVGDQLGQASALNNLGRVASRTADHRRASDHHAQALAIAHDIDAPAEQARAHEGLGQVHLQNGNPGEAARHLRQALTIYQRIGARAEAQRLEETLRHHQL